MRSMGRARFGSSRRNGSGAPDRGARLRLGLAALACGLLVSAGVAGSAPAAGMALRPAASTILRPLRSTATGDLYRIGDAADLERVQLVGYGRRSLGLRIVRRDINRGLLAVSLTGRAVGVRLVAAARSTSLRRRHGLLVTRRTQHAATSRARVQGVGAFAAAVESTPGLVSYWRLDNATGPTAADAFGSNPGTYVGRAGSGYTLGVPGLIFADPDTAASFSNGGVSVPNAAGLQSRSQLSVEAWIKPAGGTANQFIATKGGSWRLRFDSAGHLTFGVYFGSTEYQANSGRSLAPGTIHQVVGTYDGGAVRLYLDGAQVAAAGHAGSAQTSAAPLTLGYNGGSSSTYRFHGTLDEAAYYGVALNAAEVQGHYTAGTSAAGPTGTGTTTTGTGATTTTAGPTTTTPAGPTTTTPTGPTTPAPSPPNAAITSGPPAGSTQSTGSATFAFSADQSGAAFGCSLDGATFTPCSSPASYSGLANGSHTFTVEASAGGLTSAPVSVTWTVSVQSNCPVPYSSASPWNTPIASTPTVDPNSATEISTLTTNTPYPKLGSDPTQYTMPVYTVNSSTPTVPVFVSDSWSDVTDPTTLHRSYGGDEVQVPLPAGAQGASGSDSQVIVWNPATGDEWGFYQFIDASDSLTANVPAGAGTSSNPLPVQNAYADYWVGQQIVIGQGTPQAEAATISSFPDSTHMVLSSPTTNPHSSGDEVSGIGATNGYHYNTLWSGVPPTGFASRGAGVPYLAGLVRPCEIAQGHIDHALAFGYQNTTSQFVYPATKSDGGASAGLPEGSHLQLDPSIPDSTIQSWGCTGACFIAAKAMQKYGMYLVDTAGHPKVYFEYDGTANWAGAVSASTTNPIPLSDFRVIDG